MSSSVAPKPYMTYADFVAFEAASDTRHEWLDGIIYDMSGGTLTHSRLKARVNYLLGRHLEGRRCAVLDSDMALRVLATGLLTYSDVAVLCAKPEMDPENKNALTNPRVIVEVLSDSTESYDRGQKFAHYQRIPSLKEYVLVSQHEPCIEVYRQTSPGKWEMVEKAGAGQTAHLVSLECELDVDRVYYDPLAA
ncbi:MAG TPA: Uma2 family endonuclease [Polyangium sp.]|nr:Uma2 family endonuclease [Polyangium sp.]